MDIERNKNTARRLYELLNHGDAAAIGDLVSPDYEEHDPLPGQGAGREGAIDRFSMIITGLAPHFTIEDVVAEDDRVVVRWTNEGTHVGEFTGVPPTSRAFRIGGDEFVRIRATAIPSASANWACCRLPIRGMRYYIESDGFIDTQVIEAKTPRTNRTHLQLSTRYRVPLCTL